MQIPEIDAVIANSEAHITQTNAFASRIETYLTGHLLIYISAQFQLAIAKIIESELSLGRLDPKLKNFIERTLRYHFQSVNVEQLKALLDYFGASCKAAFIKKIDLNPINRRASSSYSNLIVNRHSTAHTQGAQMTFQDAKNSYLQGHVILDFFAEALR